MSDWRPVHTPTSGSSQVMGFSAPVSSGSSPNYGTLLTAGGVNVFGNWTWVANAPAIPVGGFILSLVNPSAASRYAVQLGHDTSGSSQLLLDKVMLQTPRANSGTYTYPLPLYLPTSGSILARVSSLTGSATIYVSIIPFHLGQMSPVVLSNTQSYGFSVGDSPSATQIDPGVTLNVKGAWAQIHPAISEPIRYMVVMLGAMANTSFGANSLWRVDVAVGGAGSEKAIISDMVINGGTISDDISPNIFSWPIYVPEGVRLSARAQCNLNDASDRLLNIAVLGLS